MHSISHGQYYSFWPIIKRHWKTSFPFLDGKKLFNISRSFFEFYLNKSIVKSKPSFIKIETTNRCNLSCPGCLHSAERVELNASNSGEMSLENFKKIISPLRKYLVKVSLYLEGEPLLNPEICDMVGYLSQNKIASVISSNLNIITPELARNLVKSGLTHLIISLDGFDQESYSKYRRGGRLERVLENLKLIIEEKQKQNSKYPVIEAQTVKFNYFGKTEIKKIKELAANSGAETFSLKEDLSLYYIKGSPKKRNCNWLYQSISVKWNGVLQPCCFYYEKNENNFGNIISDSFDRIWNNEKYINARKFFKTGEKNGAELQCYKCNFFKR